MLVRSRDEYLLQEAHGPQGHCQRSAGCLCLGRGREGVLWQLISGGVTGSRGSEGGGIRVGGQRPHPLHSPTCFLLTSRFSHGLRPLSISLIEFGNCYHTQTGGWHYSVGLWEAVIEKLALRTCLPKLSVRFVWDGGIGLGSAPLSTTC